VWWLSQLIHHPWSPDQASCYCSLFRLFKKFLGERCFPAVKNPCS
jgi:hypothetical protein